MYEDARYDNCVLTCRHIDVRIEEHFKSTASHIYKHLSKQQACKQLVYIYIYI